MVRVLIFFGLLFVVAAGFAWMADLPGVVTISWAGYVWERPPVVAALLLAIVLIAFLLVVWLILSILRSPKIASRFFRRRRKDRGYTALSKGLIALGAGDVKQARKFGQEAEKLLRHEPAAQLLLAQTAQLSGKDDEARARFEAMLDNPQTRALGLHGLFVEAERQNEPVAALHYAQEAVKEAPKLEWAGKAVLGYQAIALRWEDALQTLERNYTSKLIGKKTYRRHKAVVLTALAQSLEDGEPDRAFALAKEAHSLAPDLVPAAVVAARLATRKNEIRKAAKIIETSWKVSPHPDLAEAYAHVRTGDSAADRFKRVKALDAMRANTMTGALAVAKAALEAREFADAREQLKTVLQAEPSRQAFLLMAELEDAETGDRGRMQEWLARAVRAPQDPAWVADGIVSREWQAVSPVTGRLDAFVWQVPAGLEEANGGPVLEEALFEAPALLKAQVVTVPVGKSDGPRVEPDAEKPSSAKKDTPAGAEVIDVVSTKPGEPSVSDAAIAEKPEAAKTVAEDLPEPEGYEGTTDDVKFMKRPQDLTSPPAAPSTDAKPAATPKEKTPEAAAKKPAAKATEAKEELDKPIAFPLGRMPDDPGLDEEEEPEAVPKPRFFN
ncbi:heme biosynthesis HemY N-terminal domain-containing protein [Roseibium litorale]|uniref:Heme biosynthesis protein HemY n=1 Tax=Roseibium litorale TaxID=2803841 RepID=A0ABR9CME7_9HYPH|nr:heme biosynthesis HemY N-terminal domain-containing protein [Roseibium litorale]MBD8892021.1 heme biosynthesis protein HemY [Roseibium litorale]